MGFLNIQGDNCLCLSLSFIRGFSSYQLAYKNILLFPFKPISSYHYLYNCIALAMVVRDFLESELESCDSYVNLPDSNVTQKIIVSLLYPIIEITTVRFRVWVHFTCMK